MTRILTIGIVVLDTLYRLGHGILPGEKHRAQSSRLVIGGTATNGALAMARLGASPMLLARLGDDPAAETARRLLVEQGIDASLSRSISGCSTSHSAIAITPDGERTLFNFLDPNLPQLVDWLPVGLPEGTKAVLADVRWEKAAIPMFRLARAAGIPAVLDGDRAPEHPELIDLATHAVFSAQGLRELSGTDDLVEGLRRISPGRDGFLAVTDGHKGVFTRQNGIEAHYAAFKVDVVDTLGAGDTWHGAFTLALAEGQEISAAIRFASAAAAIKCTREGGPLGAPTRSELLTFLKENP